MRDLKRLSVVGVVFFVLLRMALGWQLFYEGLWKYQTQSTAKPWSSAGYLKNAQGPMRSRFRALVNDPDDLNWLDYDHVNDRWTEWQKRFVEKYELTDEQQAKLAVLMDGPDEFPGRSRLPEIAKGIKIGGSLAREKIIRFEQAEDGRYFLVVSGEKHLTPRERENLKRMGKKIEQKATADFEAATDPAKKRLFDRQAKLAEAFTRAVDDAFKRSSKLSFRERLAVLLKGDAERATQIDKTQPEGTHARRKPGEIDQYRDRVKKYNAAIESATTSFQRDHLLQEAGRIRELNTKLAGPVKQLEADLAKAAGQLLTEEQRGDVVVKIRATDHVTGMAAAQAALAALTQGEEAPPGTLQFVDSVTFFALMVLGVLLIIGFFSRTTALFASLLILSFYLAMPPFPGVPEAPGPEHSLIVNKNLVEVLALLALAVVPTGKFFGVDAMFIGLFGGDAAGAKPRRKKKKSSGSSKNLSPAEKVVQSKKEPVAATLATKDTYGIKSQEKK